MKVSLEPALSKTNTRQPVAGDAIKKSPPGLNTNTSNNPQSFMSKLSSEDKGWIKNITDSAFRAASRQAETMFDVVSDNQFVRVPFRIATEFLRNGTTATVQSVMDDKKMTKSIKLGVVRKTLENAVATAVFEPNKYTNTAARMGVGFLNMLVRFGARIALVVLNVVDPADVDVADAPDEFLSRSFGRIIRPLSANPAVGFATRFGEQVFINLGLEKLFLKNHLIPKIQTKKPLVATKAA
jgi:hypothetical protein